MYRQFLGTNVICDVLISYDQPKEDQPKEHLEEHLGKTCSELEFDPYKVYLGDIKPIPPILMGQFGGSRLCGRRSIYSFMNFTRPEIQNDSV